MFDKLFKKKPKISEEERARQYKIQTRIDTINKLKELKNLFNYLMSRYPDRRQRRIARQDFIKNDKFGEELITLVIQFQEEQAKLDRTKK